MYVCVSMYLCRRLCTYFSGRLWRRLGVFVCGRLCLGVCVWVVLCGRFCVAVCM